MPPISKEPLQRARRNVTSTAASIEVEGAGMPALGKTRPDGGAWRAETRAAWRAWWNERGISQRWIKAHVPSIRMMALLFDDAVAAPDPMTRRACLAEFRMQSREFGLSVMSMRSIGWTPKAKEPKRERSVAVPLPPGADPRKFLTLDSRRKAAG